MSILTSIAATVCNLSADGVLIDGEAVVSRDDRRSNFHALMTKRARTPRSWRFFN
jgi:ATP-dependent DNA ligase